MSSNVMMCTSIFIYIYDSRGLHWFPVVSLLSSSPGPKKALPLQKEQSFTACAVLSFNLYLLEIKCCTCVFKAVLSFKPTAAWCACWFWALSVRTRFSTRVWTRTFLRAVYLQVRERVFGNAIQEEKLNAIFFCGAPFPEGRYGIA